MMFDKDMIDTKKRKELVRKLMEKEADFKELQNRLIFTKQVETSGIKYVPEEWLKEKGIVVDYLSYQDEHFICIVFSRFINKIKLTPRQIKYFNGIINRCKLHNLLETSPIYEEYRKERVKLRG